MPEYDVILVDEAQFFAPLWIRLIQKALDLGPGTCSLWRTPPRDSRSRDFLEIAGPGCARPHASSEPQLPHHAGDHAVRHPAVPVAAGEQKDDDILVPDLLTMPNGAFPQIIPLTSPQDEIARVANEVVEFVQKGFPRKHLLVLHTNGEGVKALVQAIDDKLGKGAALDAKDTYPGDYVRVTTLNAGAGLETRRVPGRLQELFEEEQSLRLSDEERETLIPGQHAQALYGCYKSRAETGVDLCGGFAGGAKGSARNKGALTQTAVLYRMDRHNSKGFHSQ